MHSANIDNVHIGFFLLWTTEAAHISIVSRIGANSVHSSCLARQSNADGKAN